MRTVEMKRIHRKTLHDRISNDKDTYRIFENGLEREGNIG